MSPGVRQQQQQRTRTRLLTAARRVFAQHGFSEATVPRIAEEAGLSTGAIYSNFAGKEELFLAMMRGLADEGARQRAAVLATGEQDRDALLARMAGDWVGAVDEEPDAVLLLVEFWLYAVRRPQLRTLVAELLGDIRSSFETSIERVGDHTGDDRRALAMAIQALAYGFAMQRLTDPGGARPDDFSRALQWLVAGEQDTASS